LGANRVGHGVRLKESPEIMEMIVKRRIPLEMCPISNLQTKAVPAWDVYPIREYFDRGIVVTVNTDNPIVSGTNITKEYEMIKEKFGFTLSEDWDTHHEWCGGGFFGGSRKAILEAKLSR
jgi:adenosine deaminase